MKLKKFTVRYYKAIKELSVSFPEGELITVLAGQNESGKSSILEAFELFYQEGFGADSLPLLKEEYKDKQYASFRFSLNKVDYQNFSNKINEKFSEYEGFDEYLSSEIQKSSIIDEVLFELDNSEKAGLYIELDTLENIREFINEKYQNFIEKNNIGNQQDGETDNENKDDQEKSVLIDEDSKKEIKSILHKIAPKFTLFSDNNCDLLPDSITIDKFEDGKGDGVRAVKNLEKILDAGFSNIAAKSSRQRNPVISEHTKSLSADFNEVFNQKIHDENSVSITYDIDTISKKQAQKMDLDDSDVGKDFIYFSVETKEGEPLPLRLRSKGLIWFLSFWLVLESFDGEDRFILIDEPDNSLHINAQEDLKNVLEYIANKKGHRIMYATHSPHLIPTEDLHRIRLVNNDKSEGICLREISQVPQSTSQQEALLPIFEAIGSDVAKNTAIFGQRNVIVEGVSDMFALQAMQEILEIENDNRYLPGIGIKGEKINPLISMCISYGLDWFLVIDQDDGEGSYSDSTFEVIKDDVFGGDEEKAKEKVKILDQNNLEALFTIKDIESIAEKTEFNLANKPEQKDNESYIGKKRKVLFWKLFFISVKRGEISKSDISSQTTHYFDELFTTIEKGLTNGVD